MTVEYVERVYNRQASFYDQVFGWVVPERDRAGELLDLYPGAKLLEVGVGTGLNLPRLPKDIQIIGVDLSQKMLAKAQKRVVRLGIDNVELFRMDATQLDFPDNNFDHVLATFIVSVLPDPVRLVEEMKRVCRPGGYILRVNHFLSDNRVKGFFERIMPFFYRIGFNADLDLRKLMHDTALQIDVEENIDIIGHWKAIRCINPK